MGNRPKLNMSYMHIIRLRLKGGPILFFPCFTKCSINQPTKENKLTQQEASFPNKEVIQKMDDSQFSTIQQSVSSLIQTASKSSDSQVQEQAQTLQQQLQSSGS